MHIYLGTFLIALATLALEITLSRLLSVITWYYLAFFAISTAMLGMTAGATTVYLRPRDFSAENLENRITRACLEFSLVTPVSLAVLCFLPLTSDRSLPNILLLLTATAACSLPFYFSGIAVTAVLTRHRFPVGRLYASDLIGASLGCLLVLWGLEVFDAPSLVLLCGGFGILAAQSYSWRARPISVDSPVARVLLLYLIIGVMNSLLFDGIRPYYVKGSIDIPGIYEVESWNSFSRVIVYKQVTGNPHYWGASPVAEPAEIRQHGMTIDGQAGTVLGGFASPEDLDYLRFDVTNVAYYLRPKGGACVIGVGGGRDIHSAIHFGHERIDGIEVNPIFVDLLHKRYREFAGIADRDGVRLITDEARSFLSTTEATYSIIQMSLTDTWAATGAGAFSLTENALYTVEAWNIFIDRLANDGIFTVSRWFNPSDLGETGRLLSLAVASLLQSGVSDPSQHIAMTTSGQVATLLLGREAFDDDDIQKLSKVSEELQFNTVVLPGTPPSDPVLRAIVSVESLADLRRTVADQRLNFNPPTDESPYFFNMLRLSRLNLASYEQTGVGRGNLAATLTLLELILCLTLLTVLTIVLPLLAGNRSKRSRRGQSSILWSGALYFSLIGAGFMLLEIALIQRLTVFLGHPAYALGILLFTIIASAGVGSLVSEKLPLTRPPWLFIYPAATAVAVLVVRFSLPLLMSRMIAAAMSEKILVSIVVIVPLGALTGLFFPTGMRLVRNAAAAETPWYWALNGIVGVLCSALAVLISIYFGISKNFSLAAACYAAVVICVHFIRRAQVQPLPSDLLHD